MFAVCDGKLTKRGTVVAKSNANDTKEISSFLKKYVLDVMRRECLMRCLSVPFRPSLFCRSFLDGSSFPNDDVLIWKRKVEDTSDYKRTKHCILISALSSFSFPGVWFDDAFIGVPEEHSTQKKYVQQLMNDPILQYDSIACITTNIPKKGKSALISQYHIENSIRYLIKNEFKPCGEIDIIAVGNSGASLLHFFRRCPRFVFQILGRLIVINETQLEISKNFELKEEISSSKQDERDENVCRITMAQIQTVLQERMVNLVINPQGSIKKNSNVTSVGACSPSLLPSSALPRVIEYLQDAELYAILYKIRTFLVIALLAISVYFLFIIRPLL